MLITSIHIFSLGEHVVVDGRDRQLRHPLQLRRQQRHRHQIRHLVTFVISLPRGLFSRTFQIPFLQIFVLRYCFSLVVPRPLAGSQ